MHAEQLSPIPAQDPSLVAGSVIPAQPEQLTVRHRTFAEAAESSKPIPDEIAEGFVSGTLSVEDQKVGTKGFLDKVSPTEKDKQVIESPQRIAGVYLNTLEMIGRQLKVYTGNATPERKAEVRAAHDKMRTNLQTYAEAGADALVDRSKGISSRDAIRPVNFIGLMDRIDGKDLFDMAQNSKSETPANITVQRQGPAQFIMGYTDKCVVDRANGIKQPFSKRIYLNPDIKAAPEVFEKLLVAANDAGLTLNLKMFQRVSEVADIANQRANGKDGFEGLRGDGIVMYVNDAEADAALGLAIAIAQDHAEDFAGRQTSRVPTKIMGGVAVGAQPEDRLTSLTQSRTTAIEWAAHKVREKLHLEQDVPIPPDQKAEAVRLFQAAFTKVCEANGINPRNMSFNADRLRP